MKVFDCFTFFNEFDLLELRLRYLWDVVDFFVLVEADRTHSGEFKLFYFEENLDRFSWALSKIIHVKSELDISGLDFRKASRYNPGDSFWFLENSQRNDILRGLEGALPEDIILVSDVDEIPCRGRLVDYLRGDLFEPRVFSQLNHYYFFNCRAVGDELYWRGSVILPFSLLSSPQEVRDLRFVYSLIEGGGWHFSFFGGVDKIVEKVKSFAHSEYNSEEFLDPSKISVLVKNGLDLFGRDISYEFIDLVDFSDEYPDYLLDNLDKFSEHVFVEGVVSKKEGVVLVKDKFSVIVPSMWCANEYFLKMVEVYCSNSLVGEVIIIDNNESLRPSFGGFDSSKVRFLSRGENLFVNPSWNWGVSVARFDNLMIVNDDVFLTEEDFAHLIMGVKDNIKEGHIFFMDFSCFGLSRRGVVSFDFFPLDKLIPVGVGVLFFLSKSSFVEIPSQFKIWFGDEILFYNNVPVAISGIPMIEDSARTVKGVSNYWDLYVEEYKAWVEYVKGFKHHSRPIYFSRNESLNESLGFRKKVLCFFLGYSPNYVGSIGGVYGSELAVMNLSQVLSDYFDVYVFGESFSRTVSGGVSFFNSADLEDFASRVVIDVMVVSRYLYYVLEFDVKKIARKTFFWLHDVGVIHFWDFKALPFEGRGLLSNVLSCFDGFVLLNEWHKNKFLSVYDVPDSKINVIGNGVDVSLFKKVVKKVDSSFIWFQSPDRGLFEFLEFFPRVKELIPRATLNIFGEGDFFLSQEFKDLVRGKSYIKYHGKVANDVLIGELLKSDYWFYPLKGHECFPISSIEAQLAGCLCIGTNSTGLAESLGHGERGILLNEEYGSVAFWDEALSKLVEVHNDASLKNSYLVSAKSWASEQSWGVLAESWKDLFNVEDVSIFYHVHALNDWASRFEDMFFKIKSGGLLGRVSNIFVHFDGSVDDLVFFDRFEKVVVTHYSSEFVSEACTLNALRDYVSKKDGFVLYLHSKGVSWSGSSREAFVNDWVDFMSFFCVENWSLALSKLNEGFDLAGVNFQAGPNVLRHFSGNFWWARNDYVRKLRRVSDFDRDDSERWVCQHPGAKISCLFDSGGVDHYCESFDRSNYDFLIPKISWPYPVLDVHSAWKGLENYLISICYMFNLKFERAVDFGVDFGYSTHILSSLFGEVIGVDSFVGDYHLNREQGDVFFEEVSSRFRGSNVTLVRSDFRDFIKDNEGEFFDLIHVDIVHFYEDTFECVDWAVRHARVVLVHDTVFHQEMFDVCRDVSEKYGLGFLNIPHHYGLGVLFKKD